MTNKVRDAALKLYDQLCENGHPDWLTCVGDAGDYIIIFTAKRRHPKVIKEIDGIPVQVKYSGTIKPAVT